MQNLPNAGVWDTNAENEIYYTGNNVGISNADPGHNLSVGSNLYVDDTGSNVLVISGNAAMSSLTLGQVSIVASYGLDDILNTSNISSNTMQLTNATTGLVVSSNIVVTGNVTAAYLHGDVSNVTGITSNLHQIAENGNVTSNTLQFTNATTGFVTTANVEVGGELTVTGNVAVDTDTLFVDSVNDRVGIGTSSPGSTLDVNGSLRAAYDQNVTSYFGRAAIGYNGTANDHASFAHIDNNTGTDYAFRQTKSGATHVNSKAGQVIRFNISNVEKARFLETGDFQIDTDTLYVSAVNGRVGIGTTSPDKAKLQINNTLALLNPSYKSASDDDQLAGKIEFYLGGSSNELSTPVAAIEGYDKYAGGSYAGALALKVHGGEKMRILSNGNVGIGDTNPGYKLHVVGDIYSTGNITAYSDKRAKENIEKIENALDKVCTLGGYTYTMKGQKYTGLIAQEVLEVLPEAVTGSEETNYALAYGNMMGLIVEAIKELKEKIG